ncbi:unnamed protein product, partial [Mesorhabditis belari]|uniref:Huntingtin n=1 Tax=Mesorhabditis belari TaxID=2138241 RepID=A0AAF3FPG5_9BILA
MASAKVDKLIKSINGLETTLKQKEQHTPPKKAATNDKERQFCAEIREILASSDVSNIIKNDKRCENEFTRAVELLFNLVNHTDQSLRTLAEETLDAIFREQLLAFQHARVIVRLITVVAKNGPSRSLVAALNRLCSLIQYSKANRLTSYGVHIVNALTMILKRPEETVQTALEKGIPKIFDVLGPRIREQHVDKAYDLYRAAVENLDLSGSAGRSAVTIITQICQYYTVILRKVMLRCLATIRNPDENEARQRLVGSLNVVKSVWKLAVGVETADTLKGIITGILLCLCSGHNDVIEASLKALCEIMSSPLSDMQFYPPTFTNNILERGALGSEKGNHDESYNEGSSMASLVSSPIGSTLDLSVADSIEPMNAEYMEPLEIPDQESTGTLSDDGTEQGEIIDPLLHSDLYEEQRQEEEEAKKHELSQQVQSPQTPRKVEGIPKKLPEGFYSESVNCFIYSGLLIAKQFLLAGIKGLKSDREVRISHKILALNCLKMIAQMDPSIGRSHVQLGGCDQTISEIARFVLHDDDGLCGGAIDFIVTCDRQALRMGIALTDMFPYCVQRVEHVFQQKRKRALLLATIDSMELLLHYDLFSNICRLTVESVTGSYNLYKNTSAQWISSIKWSILAPKLREEWQKVCLSTFLQLLFIGEPSVEQEVAELFPRLVKNSELGALTNVFHFTLPENHVGECFDEIPVVLGLPSPYSFRNEAVDFIHEENLEFILSEMLKMASRNITESTSGLISGLAILVEAFPPSFYRECWQSAFRGQSGAVGLLSLVVEMGELSAGSSQTLIKTFAVVSNLFAGQMEGQLMRVVHEQMIPDRKSLPKQLDSLLTERLVLLPLRVLNVYYSLVTEHRSLQNQSSTGLLSRPNITQISNIKTASSARIADISRLLGTSIHPTKSSSFLESPSLKTMFPQIRGAYLNFLEKIGFEQDRRFIELLSSALDCLCVLLEMVTYQAIRPLLEEILLYLKIIFELDPHHCTRVLHQLFKLIFGKNATNINLETLQQLNMKHPLPPSDKLDMYLVRSINEFTLFAAFLNRAEFLDVYVRRHVGWLRADLLSKVHVPPNWEITSALLLFEGFINRLINMYPIYNSIPLKCAILGVMCELPRDGVKYALADPKAKLFEAILSQIDDMMSSHTSMLRQVFLYLIVLVKTNFIDWNRLEGILGSMIEKITENNVKHALSALDVVICEGLIVQKKAGDELWKLWLSKVDQIIEWDLEATASIWTIFLHHSRKEEQRWKEWSLEAWSHYREFIKSSRNKAKFSSCHAQIVFLSCLAPQTFRPIDSFFKTLKAVLYDTTLDSSTKLGKSFPLIFTMIAFMSEDKTLSRMEQLAENPNELLVRGIFDIVWKATDEMKKRDKDAEEIIVFTLQTMAYCLRSDKLPKFSALLRYYTPVDPLNLLLKLQKLSPHLYVHWLSFFSLTPSALSVFTNTLTNSTTDGHVVNITMLLLIDLIQSESLSDTHLFALFTPKEALNLPFLLIQIAEKKMIETFVGALDEKPYEHFLSSTAQGALESLNLKAAFDTLTLTKRFIEKFERIPCEEELKRLDEGIKGISRKLHEKFLEILSQTGQNPFEGVAALTTSSAPEFFALTLKHFDNCPIDSTLQNVTHLPTQHLYDIFESLHPSQREHFFTICLESIEAIVISKSALPEEQRGANARAQEILEILEDFISQNPHLALHLYSKIGPILVTSNLTWSDFSAESIDSLIQYSTGLLRKHPLNVLGDRIEGLGFLLGSPSSREIFRSNPFCHLQSLKVLLHELAYFLATSTHEPFNTGDISGLDITGLSSESEKFKHLSELFDIVQYIVMLFRKQKIDMATPGVLKLEKTIRAILRHPVLHAMALVPETAMKMEWKPRAEVRGETQVVIPLVNIHLLCNVDVLSDFTWRIRWLGWTSRQQFEDLWMSLFGVLSSTPTGTELTQENASQYTEQILASANAVNSLTELLLSSLLYPEPGNTFNSNFVVKHRERTETHRNKSMKQASAIKARLIDDKDPQTIFNRNIERLIHEVGSKYGPGQLSALALWNLTGVLRDEKMPNSPSNSPRIRASTSEYLLRMNCELGTRPPLCAHFSRIIRIG